MVGVLFAYMYLLTGKLWLSIGFHIAWNYFQGTIYGFPVSGQGDHGVFMTRIDANHLLLNGGELGPEAGILISILIILNLVLLFWWHRRKGVQTRMPRNHEG
ncbi:CPBP family intramembrane glutamic endopeptidase [Scopulibacillus darangshiensis]|uniref:CPBP family intramembrane glutamic endopeptidase n=1 Tax=Scopulibacillus darangshiensis TaxID=442528 RepID=UPI0010451524|nr:CPBP family intramembrane glutamic endopeptidase [Scopulibacillus darangshiensis]